MQSNSPKVKLKKTKKKKMLDFYLNGMTPERNVNLACALCLLQSAGGKLPPGAKDSAIARFHESATSVWHATCGGDS